MRRGARGAARWSVVEGDRGPGQGIWGLGLGIGGRGADSERAPRSAGRVGGESAWKEMQREPRGSLSLARSGAPAQGLGCGARAGLL